MGALQKPKIAEPMSGKPLLRDPNAALGVLKKPGNLGTLANYENKFKSPRLGGAVGMSQEE